MTRRRRISNRCLPTKAGNSSCFALATKTLQDMGMRNVAHIDGGYAEWKKQGAPTETLEARKAKKG